MTFLAGPSLSAFLRYASFSASFNWALLWIATSNCCQKVFQFKMLPSNVGTFTFGSLIPLLASALIGGRAVWSLSSLLIRTLRSNRVLEKAELRPKRSRSSCSSERISQVRSECCVLMWPTCSSNCRTRQISRSGPGSVTQRSSWLTSECFPCSPISYVRTGRVLRQFLDT